MKHLEYKMKNYIK